MVQLRPAWSPTIAGVPVLPADRLGDEYVMLDCPHCRQLHFHGVGPGGTFGRHLDAHCWDGRFRESGYVLVKR